MTPASKISPALTLETMVSRQEGQYYDVKSARIRPYDLADIVSAYANAEGGTVVIGISDKTRKVEGVNAQGDEKINNFLNLPKDCCLPMPEYKHEFVDVVNDAGKADRLILLHIRPSIDKVIRTTKDEVFLRIDDKSRKLTVEEIRQLEYEKALPRQFIVKRHGEDALTNAAILLFGKNVLGFFPNCRIRYIKVDGTAMRTGTNFNVVKDRNFDLPLLRLIPEVKRFVSEQLEERTTLESDGRFHTYPEYPEFAWVESITNIFTTRFARNPIISRVLTEMELVRELNEGVPRIFKEMKDAGLPEPRIVETAANVIVVLHNGKVAQDSKPAANSTTEKTTEKIMRLLAEQPSITAGQLAEELGITIDGVDYNIRKLKKQGRIVRIGGDKGGHWKIIDKQ